MKKEPKVFNLKEARIPPQAVDLEEAVLGALLIDSRGFDEIGDFLMPEMFYEKKHQIIYEVIVSVYNTTGSVDMLTVANELRKKEKIDEVGGDYYIVLLTQKVASSAHIEYHSRIIVEKYIQRRIISKSAEITERAYQENNDVFDLLDESYDNLNSIADLTLQTQDTLFGNIIDTQIERAEKIYKGEIKAGLPTPIKKLTNKTGGWRDTELIILAARPGMGKTAFVLKCGLHLAHQDIPVAIFTLEMSKEKLTDRILSMEAKVDGDKFNIHGLSEFDLEHIKPVRNKLKDIPLYIDDNSNMTITQFQVKAKRLHNKYGIKLIIVDYLQLMVGKGNNREQEISKISRGLKLTAMELKIPIIALSQLSRAVETRGGSKRPMLSDLRESGAIEQDADMVGFLYRPEYYGIIEWDDYDHASTEGECEYIIAKNRNGGLIRNRMKFEGRYTLFSDLEENDLVPTEISESQKLKNIGTDEAFGDDDVPF